MIALIVLLIFASWRWGVWKHRTHVFAGQILAIKIMLHEANKLLEEMKEAQNDSGV